MEQQLNIDLTFISKELGIEPGALVELFSIYKNEVSQEILRVKELLMNEDWVGLQRSVHSIKGVSANLFIQPMYEAAATIDSKLKAMDLDNIANDVGELINIYDSATVEIDKIIKLNK